MSGPPAARVLLVDGGQPHDVLELVELTEATARVRTAYLLELGEELKLRIEQDGRTFDTTARVLAHAGGADDKITELELGERAP